MKTNDPRRAKRFENYKKSRLKNIQGTGVKKWKRERELYKIGIDEHGARKDYPATEEGNRAMKEARERFLEKRS